MNNHVNVAVQVLPSAQDKHPYDLVDKAIEVIQKSGLKYQVCPFETVIEGDYHKVMEVVKQVQDACYEAGAESLMTYIKIQSRRDDKVTIEDKMEKYS
ncbi:MTH1187 family thiamine-binding protein [Limibacter armeniacum]|uniref:MTH1187 family thiamine-binding protein n=1 Tax=Limibacter armeniacum TaxID=466084 RepID=UPI002FE6866C